MKPSISVLKIGGQLIQDEDGLCSFCLTPSRDDVDPVISVGNGEISDGLCPTILVGLGVNVL